jgi:putative restriction endonuclease
MSQPRRWVDEVKDALRDLGGEGWLSEIYRQIRKRNCMNFASNPRWEPAVRNALEKHSSDSEAFAHRGDYFRSVNGIGSGRWGLR